MIDVKTLAGRVVDELCDSLDYMKMAAECRETDPELSRTLSEISAQETEHMNRLHKALTAKVKSLQEIYQR